MLMGRYQSHQFARGKRLREHIYLRSVFLLFDLRLQPLQIRAHVDGSNVEITDFPDSTHELHAVFSRQLKIRYHQIWPEPQIDGISFRRILSYSDFISFGREPFLKDKG